MARIQSLEILKAAPQHAEALGSSGMAMLLAVTSQWDSLGSSIAVCWSNSRLSERTGLSRNSIPEVRARLIKLGWLVYIQDGRNSGHYTPKLPDYHAQTSAIECANGAQFTVQTVCNDGAMTVQLGVQALCNERTKECSSLGSYIPIPVPNPISDPIPTSVADAPVAKTRKRKTKAPDSPEVECLKRHSFRIRGGTLDKKNALAECIRILGPEEADRQLGAMSGIWAGDLLQKITPPTIIPARPQAPPINLDFT